MSPVAPGVTRRGMPAAALAIAVLLCFVLGGLSVLSHSWVPSYDVFSWIVWGREIAHHVIGPHEPFLTAGGPSWKPLPVVFTTIFGFFGPAPKLWVGFARGLGLLGLVFAYRAGSRLGRSAEWAAAGPVAGILAALGVFLTTRWTHYMLRGTSEPIVLTATLLALDAHLARRRWIAFWAGVALALMRPEAGLFVLVYALWLFRETRSNWARVLLVIGVLLIPIGWIVPPWLASHNPLLASRHARDYNGHLGPEPLAMVLKRATNLTVWPVIVAAAAETALAIRRRDWLTVRLAAASLAYVAVVAAMALDHYPGLERFMLPAAAIACVLAGVGAARVAALAGGGLRSAALAAALVAVAVPFFAGRITSQRNEKAQSEEAAVIYGQMLDAMHRAGGPRRMLPCGGSRVAINHSIQPSLAWAMKVPLVEVLPVNRRDLSLRRPALLIEAPRNKLDGGAPHAFDYGLRGHVLLRMGKWKLIRVTEPGATGPDRCVGT